MEVVATTQLDTLPWVGHRRYADGALLIGLHGVEVHVAHLRVVIDVFDVVGTKVTVAVLVGAPWKALCCALLLTTWWTRLGCRLDTLWRADACQVDPHT